MADIEVRRLGPQDWERSRAIRLRSLKEVPEAFWATFEQEQAYDEAAWRDRLSSDRSATYLASIDDQDVGCAVAAHHHEHAGVAALYAMYVAPGARGRGVGEALVQSVIDWARDRGFDEVRLDVGDWNQYAIALYRRMGFEPTGRRDTFPPPRDDIDEHELAFRVEDA